MNIKRFEVAVKYAETEDGIGYITGYGSTFDRIPDAYGDIVKPGAFKNSLKRLEDSGTKLPFLWAHKMDDLKSFIGIITELEEDDKGLKFTAKFDDTPEAQRIRQLYKDGRLSKFSFAYDTLDSGPVELEDGTTANELRELEIFEISAVLIPANGFAEVLDVKEGIAESKSGKRNSTKDEQTLKDAIALLQSLLEEVVDNAGSENGDEGNSKDGESKEKDQVIVNEKADNLLTFIENM